MVAAAMTTGLVKLLGEVGISLDQEQADALDARLTALVAQAGPPAASLVPADCWICGCPLADMACGHSCCCSGGRR